MINKINAKINGVKSLLQDKRIKLAMNVLSFLFVTSILLAFVIFLPILTK